MKEGFPNLLFPQLGYQIRQARFFEFFIDVLHSGIVVGQDGHGFPAHQDIGDDVQYRLGLACAGRPFDHTDLRRKRLLDGA
ncbi:hypothetical protein D3C87_1956370 [compost metagenome]